MVFRVIDDRSGHQGDSVADDHSLSPGRTPRRGSRLYVLRCPCGHRSRGRIRRNAGGQLPPWRRWARRRASASRLDTWSSGSSSTSWWSSTRSTEIQRV